MQPGMETAPQSPSPSRRAGRKFRRRKKKDSIPSLSGQTNPQSTTTTPTTIEPNKNRLSQVLEEIDCGYDADAQSRRVALDHLEKILARWAMTLRSVGNTSQWQRPRPALISFGSYRLGVDRRDSDLDVLVLAPPSSSRQDFFGSLVSLLQEDSRITDLHPIPGAYTPVIKFVFNGTLPVDMLFARVQDGNKLLAYQQKRVSPLVQTMEVAASLPRRPEYEIDDSDLVGLDGEGVRSLNGARVSQILLQTVRDLDSYRLVLRAVKEWALSRGIYSNVLGFLGGVNWAILVAWVARRHPLAGPEALLEAFFRTFAKWEWPRPVLLGDIQETPPAGTLQLQAWNPKNYPRDSLHIMPIITPAYPSMNSSYNVGVPQMRRIKDEMIRASNLLKASGNDYKALFTDSSEFFYQHEHFLQITVRADNRQDFVKWFRLVESRLRLLMNSLETTELNAWPFARFFERRYDQKGFCLGNGRSDPDCRHESHFFCGLRFAPELEQLNLRYLTSDFLHKVNSWPERTASMDLSVAHVTSDGLPRFLFDCNDDLTVVESESSSECESSATLNLSPTKKVRKAE